MSCYVRRFFLKPQTDIPSLDICTKQDGIEPLVDTLLSAQCLRYICYVSLRCVRACNHCPFCVARSYVRMVMGGNALDSDRVRLYAKRLKEYIVCQFNPLSKLVAETTINVHLGFVWNGPVWAVVRGCPSLRQRFRFGKRGGHTEGRPYRSIILVLSERLVFLHLFA